MEARKILRSMIEKAQNNRLLLEIWILMPLLVRGKVKVGYAFIGDWRKEDPYYKVGNVLRIVSCGYVEKSLM